MEIAGRHYCDICFEPLTPGAACTVCGKSIETYRTEPGLLRPGEVLAGKYVIGRTLGRGGFGATYLAFNSQTNSRVAIKEYYPTGIAHRNEGERSITVLSNDKEDLFQKGSKRFFEEAKIIATFNDAPNVMTVYEFFYENNTAYYVMEYLEGVDLKQYTEKRGGRITEGEAIVIMEQICSALINVHSTGTIHRDISPDNIFICDNNMAKLIDFGAAKQFVGEESQSLSVVLKGGFAPVEQYSKNGEHGMWTDIYALGATIYYTLTGRVPDDAMSRIDKRQEEIPHGAELGISEQFRNVINKCMRLRYQERYKSAVEIQNELRHLPVQRSELVLFAPAHSNATYGSYTYTNIPQSGSTQFVSQGGTSQQGGTSTVTQNQGFPNSQNFTQWQQSQFVSEFQSRVEEDEHKKNVAVIAGIAGAVIAIILVIALVFVLTKPTQQMPPGPPPMGPGGPPPMGFQGGSPPGVNGNVDSSHQVNQH